MFIFGKRLFSLVKSKESFQEDAILNSLLYSSSHSVFTTTEMIKKSSFSSNLVTVHYEKETNPAKIDLIDPSNRQVHSIKLNVKVIWPLNIIIQPHNFEAYNKIFIFIMQIKQAKYELDSLDLKGKTVNYII